MVPFAASFLLLLRILWHCSGSEFPERECCDPVYPLAAVSASISPETPTPHSPTTSPGDENAIAETLNCLLARQLCFEDPSCSPILETIPRVCGPEVVSCSTVTVTKCQAALRTLQAFPFFDPTCLCREPQIDHDCNSFRNFLFDHPCIFVMKKEKDPYPIDALPTCNHALSVCQKDDACLQIFDHFKSHCKVRDGKCSMEDREMCLESWTQIRLTPMFGCICPINQMKKRCDRIFTLVNHNPCLVRSVAWHGSELVSPWIKDVHLVDLYTAVMGLFRKAPPPQPSSGAKPQENNTLSFQNTCDEALLSCREDSVCKTALAAIVQYCSRTNCRRDICMNSLQNFYRSVDHTWSLEVAFCLCKKTKNPKDECVAAQDLLHPTCAQQAEDKVEPSCHSVAQTCLEDPTCRMGLENYVQACAVDAVTKQCAGPSEGCRVAMMGILGTGLRSNCACKGTDFSQLYNCMGWQRVLWFNPCVVESQRDFHARKMTKVATERSATVGSTPSKMIMGTVGPTSSSLGRTTLGTSVMTSLRVATTKLPPTSRLPPTTIPTTPTTSTTTTTTLRPTLPAPASRYCVVQKPDQKDQYIAEGDGKRLYREGEPDCSDLCLCRDGSLTCNTLCVERRPCRTDFAFYNHAAPAYQAYRGRCLCYSGRFICMRPPPDEYELKQGVYLFLGYSELDEEKLRAINQMEVQDAVTSLHDLLRLHVKPKTPCMLSLYNRSDENVILVAKLADHNSTLTKPHTHHQPDLGLLLKQKEECEAALQEICEMINSHDPIVHSHIYLSIFKMAEVEVIYPTPSSAVFLQLKTFLLITGICLTVFS